MCQIYNNYGTYFLCFHLIIEGSPITRKLIFTWGKNTCSCRFQHIVCKWIRNGDAFGMVLMYLSWVACRLMLLWKPNVRTSFSLCEVTSGIRGAQTCPSCFQPRLKRKVYHWISQSTQWPNKYSWDLFTESA